MINMNIVSEVELWARVRGLDRPSNSSNQIIKLMEEVGELSAAYNSDLKNELEFAQATIRRLKEANRETVNI